MSVRILYFGATADLTGTREHILEFEEFRKVSEVVDHQIALFPRLGGRNLLISLNQEYINANEVIHDGDEVGIFTAVSGG